MIRAELPCCSTRPLTSAATSLPLPDSTIRFGTRDINTGGSTSSAIARAMKFASTAHTLGVSSARSSIPRSVRINPSKNCSLPYTLVSPDRSTLAISLSASFFSRDMTRTRLTTSWPNLPSLSPSSCSAVSLQSGLAKKSSRIALTCFLCAVMGSGSLSCPLTTSAIFPPLSPPATRGREARIPSGSTWSSTRCATMPPTYSTALGASIRRSSSCLTSKSTPASTCALSTAPRCTSDDTRVQSMSLSLWGFSSDTARTLQTRSAARSPALSSSMLCAASLPLSHTRYSSATCTACIPTASGVRGVPRPWAALRCTACSKEGETRSSKASQSARVRRRSAADGTSRHRSGRPATARPMPFVSCTWSITRVFWSSLSRARAILISFSPPSTAR
mmetsp:Transcript_37574/g.96007  ORF Transcript_37574/g.96007 Transcript_37574/m.96007 type:complete len:391 (+) Transcript_37574:191-1363(+)